MPDNIYEIISLAMRYWFTALGALIVWRAFSWLRKDRRLKHKRLRTLPDAGMIGEMVVIEGSRDLPEDTLISVPREGVLGFLRSCDLVVPVNGVNNQHADFVFVSGKGLRIFPRRGCECTVDGEKILSRRDAKQHPMGHHSTLVLGEAVLRLRLFAGLDAPYHPGYDEEESPLPEDALAPEQPAWPPVEGDWPLEGAPREGSSPQSLYPPQRSPYGPAPYPQGGQAYPQNTQPYGPVQPYPQSTQPYGPAQPYPQNTRPYGPVQPPPQNTSPYAPPPSWSPYADAPVNQDAPRANRRRRYDEYE